MKPREWRDWRPTRAPEIHGYGLGGNEEAIMSKEMSKCVIGRPKRMNGTELFFVF